IRSCFVPKALPVSGGDSSRVSVIEKKRVENPIIVIDNYDSFTYNLCQLFAIKSKCVTVKSSP
ncbi:hypothetical protein GIB67_008844, partial [Kingdonia uniflora]